MTLPNNVSTGTVTGQFIVAVADGSDSDYDPDTYPVGGTVTFTPSVPYLPDPSGGVTILAAAITGIFDGEGFLCTPDPDNSKVAGRRGVQLIATDDPDLSVTGWTWKVSYAFTPLNKVALPQVPPHDILVPSGGTVDLTSAVKVPSSTGVGLDQVTIIRAQALQSAEDASASATLAGTRATEASGFAAAAAGSASSAAGSASSAASAATTAATAALGLKLDKAAPNMANAQDLRTYLTTGNWNVQSNSTASGGTNYPVPLAGMFGVVARSTNDSVIQTYKVYATGDRYECMFYGGTWSTWKKASFNVDQMFLNPKDYGVIGDGVANDSAALQSWLTAGGVRLANMTCRVTTGLTLAGDNRTLYTDNATILANTADMTVLTVTGNKCRVSVNIDGNSKANYGIKSSGAGGTIERCRIENIYSATTTARAIEVTTSGGATIRNNTINNVTSVGNATRGDGNGFARAILLYGGTAAATKRSYILDNVIDGIVGEEGDAIAVLFDDGVASTFLSAKTTVRGNQLSNVSRRFIKIQGSDTRVEGNHCAHDGTVPANPSTAIDLIQSDNVTVIDNTITPNPLSNGIASNGTSGAVNKNLVIKGNVIRQDDAKTDPAIYLNYAKESDVSDNTVHGGGSAVSIGNSTNMAVIANKHFGGLNASVSFSANSTNTGVVMRLNTNMNSARTTYVSNTGTGALTELNAARV